MQKADLMKKLTQVVLKMDDLDKFLNALTALVAEGFGLRWVSLALADEAGGQYTVKASFSQLNPGQAGRKASIDNAVSWLRERQKTVTQRLLEEFGPQMHLDLIGQLNQTDTFVSMPLFAGERLLGIFNLGPKQDNQQFSKQEVESFSELARLLASLIEQALLYNRTAQQRRHHQNILDNLVSGIVAVDPENKITVFNRAAERILKFKADQLLGQDVHMLQPNLADLLLDTLHKGKSYRREELFILPEKTLIGVSTCQFYDAAGKLLGACMVFSNLVEIRRKARVRRQKDLDNYWSNVANSLAHEVKNSIVATKVFAQMFPQKYDDAEFRWSLYSALTRDMGKLDNFTERVLQFAQPQELLIRPYRINAVIDAAINTVLEEKDAGNITFEKRYGPDLPSFSGDYERLKQAFAYVISNALEAMGKSGKLNISVNQEESPQMLSFDLPEAVRELPANRILVVKISDTGCGIQPEHLGRLFDPFFTTKQAKVGLGLASARKIIQQHQGFIYVQSKPKQGATFWVCLPILSGQRDSVGTR